MAIVTAPLETVLLRSSSSLTDASLFVLLLPEQSAAAETLLRLSPHAARLLLQMLNRNTQT
jgi:hypothetical protein